MIDPGIFRKCDIRGVWGRYLTREAVRGVARAFAYYLKQNLPDAGLSVTVGRDIRLSSLPVYEYFPTLIKSKMKETGALLAGEMSGHIFFADRYFGFDDAIYASLRLLEVLSEKGKP